MGEKSAEEKVKIREEVVESVKEEIDHALSDCDNETPSYIIIKIILGILDKPDLKLKGMERMAVLDYVTKVYGYNF